MVHATNHKSASASETAVLSIIHAAPLLYQVRAASSSPSHRSLALCRCGMRMCYPGGDPLYQMHDSCVLDPAFARHTSVCSGFDDQSMSVSMRKQEHLLRDMAGKSRHNGTGSKCQGKFSGGAAQFDGLASRCMIVRCSLQASLSRHVRVTHSAHDSLLVSQPESLCELDDSEHLDAASRQQAWVRFCTCQRPFVSDVVNTVSSNA